MLLEILQNSPRLRAVLYIAFLSLCVGCAGIDSKEDPARQNDAEFATLTLPSGKTTRLKPLDMDYSGQATLTLADGSSRSGTWKNGQLEGMAMEETTLATYSGQWHNNMRHGHGELKYRNGDSYVGDFAEDLAHGRGILTSSQGVYRGTWSAGKKQGQGQFNANGGNVYQGQWDDDLRSGFGLEQYGNGDIYSGQWRNDQPHGFGEYTERSGARYEGSWVAGQRSGYGTSLNTAQMRYEGTWQKGLRQGFGKETRPDGSSYEGSWAQDLRHGQGMARFANGSRHQGQWLEDKITGSGQRTSRGGVVLSGEWHNGMLTQGQLLLPKVEAYGGPLFDPGGRAVAPALFDWLQTQAAAQQPYAQYFLGSVLLDFDWPTQDINAAMIWLQKSADAGVTEAQFRLAQLLREHDIRQAVSWLQTAAASDHPSAHEMLGDLYYSGLYFEQNMTLAQEHYTSAHNLGSIAGTNNLAWLLATTAQADRANPQRAIELIQPLVLYLGQWQHLDTLAAAHARQGNTELAARLQDQALLQARQEASNIELNDMTERLNLYRIQLPFIQ